MLLIGLTTIIVLVAVTPSAGAVGLQDGRSDSGPAGTQDDDPSVDPQAKAPLGDSDPSPASDQALQISAITPWVDSEGEFQIRFSTSSSVPPDAQLTYTIHQSVRAAPNRTLREAVSTIIEGGQAGKVLQAPVTAPLSEFGAAQEGSVLSIPVRSRSSADRTRAFLPSSGIHPVSLVLTTPEGPELWSTIVFLNHLPRAFGTDNSDLRPLTVSLVVPVETRPVFTSGQADFDIRDRAALDGLRNLLTGAPRAPLKVFLRGNAIAGLLHTSGNWAEDTRAALLSAFGPMGADNDEPSNTPGDGDDEPQESDPSTTQTTTTQTTTAQTTTTISPGESEAPDNPKEDDSPTGGRSVTGPGPVLVAAPFVALDTEALVRAGGGDVVDEQIKLGSQIASTVTTSPLLQNSWIMDEHVGPSSLPIIRSLGFTNIVVARSQIATDDRDASTLVSRTPLRLTEAPSMKVLAYDDELSALLVDDSVSPATRTHDVVTSLVADWFEANSGRDRLLDPTSVIVIQPTIRPEVVASLGSALTGAGPIRSSSDSSLLASEPNLGGDPESSKDPEAGESQLVSLRAPRLTDGVPEALRQFTQSQRTIGAFASMAASEPLLELWRLRSAESLDASLSTGDVSKIHESIRAEIAERTALITPPPSRRVVLATSDTTIPLRFKNALPYPVTLTLEARSPRLEVAGGRAEQIVLEPGSTQIDLPVVVRAPGESLLRIRLTTPEGDVDIATFDTSVQSTAISGVGAALSVVSVLFIILWWGRTFRRDRREQARNASAHPSSSRPDE